MSFTSKSVSSILWLAGLAIDQAALGSIPQLAGKLGIGPFTCFYVDSEYLLGMYVQVKIDECIVACRLQRLHSKSNIAD